MRQSTLMCSAGHPRAARFLGELAKRVLGELDMVVAELVERYEPVLAGLDVEVLRQGE